MASRVLIAQFMHETNTFSKLPTTLEDYRRQRLVEGAAIVPNFSGARNELGGFIDAAKTHGWEPVWGVAANTIPSGPLTREAWEHIRDRILDAARGGGDGKGSVDAVCLSLHGAMVSETEDDAEGALLEAVRGVVGPDVPVVVTLDLHANATARMARHANALVSYRTYPHVDGYERAQQAAQLVEDALQGRKSPRCLLVQPAMLKGADHGRTTQPGIMRDLLARAEAFEKQPGLNVVSIQVGFTWSDIQWAGPSIAVSHEPGAEDAAAQAAEALIAEMWARRTEFSSSYRSIDEAVTAARRGGDRPLVLAEGTDNPGGGGYNDAPNLLRALLEAGIPNVAVGTIYDPGTVRQALKAGVGARIEVALGGHTDPSLGAAVQATAEVRHLSDGNFRNDGPMNAGVQVALGATAVLRLGDSIDVVVTSTRMHTIDLQVFLSQGIDPLSRNVLVVKSSQHFRAAFEPIAREVMLVDAGGLCSTDASRFTYAKLRRPIWPLDPVEEPFSADHMR